MARGGPRRGIGGGPVHHAGLNKLERLAGPSVPSFATPYSWLDLTPRFSQRAEWRWSMRLKRSNHDRRFHLAVFICSKLASIPRSVHEAGLELGVKLLETNKDNAMPLNNDFWFVISPRLEKEPDPRVARLALQAARRAVELTKGENVAILDTLAEAQFRTGDATEAVATEEKALKLIEAQYKRPIPPRVQAVQRLSGSISQGHRGKRRSALKRRCD